MLSSCFILLCNLISNLRPMLDLVAVQTQNAPLRSHPCLLSQLLLQILVSPCWAHSLSSQRFQSLLVSQDVLEEEGTTLRVLLIGITRSSLSSRYVCWDTQDCTASYGFSRHSHTSSSTNILIYVAKCASAQNLAQLKIVCDKVCTMSISFVVHT